MPYVTGAEDFAFYGQKVPALFFFVGVTPPGQDPRRRRATTRRCSSSTRAASTSGVRALLGVAVDYLQGTPR